MTCFACDARTKLKTLVVSNVHVRGSKMIRSTERDDHVIQKRLMLLESSVPSKGSPHPARLQRLSAPINTQQQR